MRYYFGKDFIYFSAPRQWTFFLYKQAPPKDTFTFGVWETPDHAKHHTHAYWPGKVSQVVQVSTVAFILCFYVIYNLQFTFRISHFFSYCAHSFSFQKYLFVFSFNFFLFDWTIFFSCFCWISFRFKNHFIIKYLQCVNNDFAQVTV